MQRKKIDDTVLLEMFNAGRLQKEIARHFGCSPVAVCKRLKRLLPDPDHVLDNHNLTEQERRFVIEKAKGKNNTQAALEAYECGSLQSAKTLGCRLMKDPDVKTAMKDLLASEGLTRRYRIRRLRDHIDNRDPNISLKGLDMSFRLDGGYAPEKHMVATVSYQEVCKARQENIENLKSLVALDPTLIEYIPQEILDEHPEIMGGVLSQPTLEETNGD